MSLIYIKNNNGPKIDPCGTPHRSKDRACVIKIEQIVADQKNNFLSS